MLVLVVPMLFVGVLGGSFGGLLFSGFFMGVAGSSFAVGVPFVSRWFPPHMQGLALGVYGIGTIETAVAAYTAPAIAAFYGWRWAFWVFDVPLVAMAVVFWAVGRDAPSAGPRPSAAAGIVLFTFEALSSAVLFGLGNGAVFKLVAGYYPDKTGAVTGLVGAAGGLGGFFPPLVLGVVRDATGSYSGSRPPSSRASASNEGLGGSPVVI